jgi:hypothetical protein
MAGLVKPTAEWCAAAIELVGLVVIIVAALYAI